MAPSLLMFGRVYGPGQGGQGPFHRDFIGLLVFVDDVWEECLGERADGEGVEDGADADGSAEEPAAREDQELDAGPDQAQGHAGPGVEASGEPVAGAGAEPGADVAGGGEAVEDDARDEEPGPQREAVGIGAGV